MEGFLPSKYGGEVGGGGSYVLWGLKKVPRGFCGGVCPYKLGRRGAGSRGTGTFIVGVAALAPTFAKSWICPWLCPGVIHRGCMWVPMYPLCVAVHSLQKGENVSGTCEQLPLATPPPARQAVSADSP